MDPSEVQHQGGGMARKSQLPGPCYLKVLVNNVVAGSIIGKSGTVIASIEQNSGATVKLSSPNKYYPGTQDRIVVMSGALEQLNNSILIILEKIKELGGTIQHGENSANAGVDGADLLEMQQNQGSLTTKLALPKSSISAIIGKGGRQIKALQETTGANVRISSREDGYAERTVTITGSFEAVQNAVLTIASTIQSDTNLKEHMYLNYDNRPGGGMGGVGFGGQGAGSGFGGMGGANGFGQGGFGGQGGFQGQGMANDFNPRCEVVVYIPDEAVGTVIGKGGAVLNEIQNQSGARVQISNKGDLVPGTSERKCTISGTMASVHNAHFQLMQRLEQYQAKVIQGGAGGTGAMAGAQNGGMAGHPMGGAAGGPQMMAAGAMGGMVPQQHQLYNPHMMQQQAQQGGYMQGY